MEHIVIYFEKHFYNGKGVIKVKDPYGRRLLEDIRCDIDEVDEQLRRIKEAYPNAKTCQMIY